MQFGLNNVLETEAFRICGLLNTDRFITFCKERKIKTSKKALERLEELGIFFPIARATHWPYKAKVRTVNERGGYELLDPLDSNEQWNGETRTEYAQFYFGHPETDQWLNEGHLWDPKLKPYKPWDSFRSDDGFNRMVSYYSPFQAYELWHRTNYLKRQISAEFWILDPEEWSQGISKWAEDMLAFAEKHFFRYDISKLCQFLSNRYYPLTQTNQRYFTISPPHDWDWYNFCAQWEAKEALHKLSLTQVDIRKAWEMLVMDAKSCDPMEKWYDLISFTAIDKRKKLKGDALRAQTWYTMEHMLRLFYQDIMDEQLPTPEGPVTYKFVPGYEQPVESDPLIQLEQLTNDFNINPRPVLILLVEGESEAKVVPEIMEQILGSSPSTIGVQVISLKGVGNIDGAKKYDPQSALVRFVDDYHTRGTIVFIILDNEGRASKTKQKLLKAKSLYENRMVTRDEYVIIWDKNVEFDNFSNDEIASSMNSLIRTTTEVTEEQIEQARATFGKPNGTRLESVFETASASTLNKPLLLSVLARKLSNQTSNRDDKSTHPILSILSRVIKLAHENRPESSQWRKEYLAKQGLYGELLSGSSSLTNDANDKGGNS